jgi:hypothetical protein
LDYALCKIKPLFDLQMKVIRSKFWQFSQQPTDIYLGMEGAKIDELYVETIVNHLMDSYGPNLCETHRWSYNANAKDNSALYPSNPLMVVSLCSSFYDIDMERLDDGSDSLRAPAHYSVKFDYPKCDSTTLHIGWLQIMDGFLTSCVQQFGYESLVEWTLTGENGRELDKPRRLFPAIIRNTPDRCMYLVTTERWRNVRHLSNTVKLKMSHETYSKSQDMTLMKYLLNQDKI